MKFYPRRRRSAPSIIIISLIDVLIVMLTFLMVTTTYRNQPSVTGTDSFDANEYKKMRPIFRGSGMA